MWRGPGSGFFVRYVADEAAGRRNPALGYAFAVAAACISGVSVYVNSLGVRAFADPVVYTTLKDGLVGLVLLAPLVFSAGWRAEYAWLDARTRCCHFTPGCRWKVYVFPSCETSQLSARSGWGFSCASRKTSPL